MIVFVIIVYDVNVSRVNEIRKFLRQYLDWVQNSVFQGDLTRSEFEYVKSKIKEIIDENEDSVRIYILRSEKYIKIEQIGLEKSDLQNIV